MKSLGTILPTAKSLAINDAHFEKEQRLNFTYADNHPLLGISPRVWEKGEHRWIIAPTIYAVVGNQTAKFFERRHDGDYAIKYSPK
jgi:hypothetical protein